MVFYGMKKLIGLLGLVVLLNEACHRPYALYQRTSLLSIARTSSRLVIPDSLSANNLTLPVDTLVVALPIALASAGPLTAQQSQQIEHHLQRAAQLVHGSASVTDEMTEVPQPRPRPKNQLRLGNRIRQGLGVPLRKELNWWQRIPWQLKAAVPVIIVAVVFAILNITLLAIIFGILGAFLLIKGLKKSFKVRRPWL